MTKSLFGPPGCFSVVPVQHLIVRHFVPLIVVKIFKEIIVSAGAFSGRPAISRTTIIILPTPPSFHFGTPSQHEGDFIAPIPDIQNSPLHREGVDA